MKYPNVCLILSFALFGYVSTALAADPPAASEEESHEEAGPHENSSGQDRIVVLEKKKEIDPEVANEEVLGYLSLGVTSWKGRDITLAEKYFAAALGVNADVPAKENVLYEMAKLYNEEGMLSKSAAVYERLIREFPSSRRIPDSYFELGYLYRRMGALELAETKFYSVLNAAVNVSFDQLAKYKELSLKSKLEIARTLQQRGQFIEAYDTFQDLFRLELKPVDRIRVHYEMCYLLYELERYQQGVSQMKLFLEGYPENFHQSEIRYLLAKSYERLNRKPEALREVVQILKKESNFATAEEGVADYWKQRTGNELANEFYQKGDFRSALTIYQALARYSESPEWRWPAIHQIGLCFERLGLPEKAKMAYEEISESLASIGEEQELTESLLSLSKMAKWRLEHLNWEDDLHARLNILKTQ
ncbi:tetratricopeptide repeat protein [Puniceicoccaceae bacterium K14]|nr:tetratricopeptide repeat protein [Puniceicoccaceae bacterium K14]